jgi:hypothetical protein
VNDQRILFNGQKLSNDVTIASTGVTEAGYFLLCCDASCRGFAKVSPDHERVEL